MRKPLILALALAALSGAAFAKAPEPAKKIDPKVFYNGRWIEIGRRPMFITNGCVAGTTDYRRTGYFGGTATLQTECHQTQCKLVLDGDQKSVGKAIATMESTEGLQGFASTIFLTAPEQRTDGTITLRAFATFAR